MRKAGKRIALLLVAAMIVQSVAGPFGTGDYVYAARPAKSAKMQKQQDVKTREVPAEYTDINAAFEGKEAPLEDIPEEEITAQRSETEKEEIIPEWQQKIPVLEPVGEEKIHEQEFEGAGIQTAEENDILSEEHINTEEASSLPDPDFSNVNSYPELTLDQSISGTLSVNEPYEFYRFTPEHDGYYQFCLQSESRMYLGIRDAVDTGYFSVRYYTNNDKLYYIVKLQAQQTALIQIQGLNGGTYTVSVQEPFVTEQKVTLSDDRTEVELDASSDLVSLIPETTGDKYQNWKVTVPDGLRMIMLPGGLNYEPGTYGQNYIVSLTSNTLSEILLAGCSQLPQGAKVILEKQEVPVLKTGKNDLTAYPGQIVCSNEDLEAGEYVIIKNNVISDYNTITVVEGLDTSILYFGREAAGSVPVYVEKKVVTEAGIGKEVLLSACNRINYQLESPGFYELSYNRPEDVKTYLYTPGFKIDPSISYSGTAINYNTSDDFITDDRTRLLFAAPGTESASIDLISSGNGNFGTLTLKKAEPKALTTSMTRQYMDADSNTEQLFTFTPDEDGIYNFYTDNEEGRTTISCLEVYRETETGYSQEHMVYPDYLYDGGFNENMELKKGVRYVFLLQSGVSTVRSKQSFFFTKTEQFKTTLNEESAYKKDATLNKSVYLSVTVDKPGFYGLSIDGSQESYLLRGSVINTSTPQFVYKDMTKTLFFSSPGTYEIWISNESASPENITIHLDASGAAANMPLYSGSHQEKLAIDLPNPEDDSWASFTPSRDGMYVFTTVTRNVDVGFYEKTQTEIQWYGYEQGGRHGDGYYAFLNMKKGNTYYIRLRPRYAGSYRFAISEVEDIDVTTADTGKTISYDMAAHVTIRPEDEKEDLYSIELRSNRKVGKIYSLADSCIYTRYYSGDRNLTGQGTEFYLFHLKGLEKEHAFTVDLTKRNTVDAGNKYFSQSVRYSEVSQWFKYTPETSGTYLFRNAGNMDMDIGLYRLENNRLRYHSGDGVPSGLFATLYGDETYYIEVNTYNPNDAAGTLIMSECSSKIETKICGKYEWTAEVKDAARLGIPVYAGEYRLSVSGLPKGYQIDSTGTDLPSLKGTGETLSTDIFIRYSPYTDDYDEDEDEEYDESKYDFESNLDVLITSDEPADETVSVTVSIEPADKEVEKTLSPGQSYMPQGDGIHKIAVSVPENGMYSFKGAGVFSSYFKIFKQVQGALRELDDSELEYSDYIHDHLTNRFYYVFKLNRGDYIFYFSRDVDVKKEEVEFDRFSSVYIFDQEEVAAFKASGGVITLTEPPEPVINPKDYDSEEDYEDAYDEMWHEYRSKVRQIYNWDHFIYLDASNFKPQYKGQEWLPEITGSGFITGTGQMLQDALKGKGADVRNWHNNYEFRYFCDENGTPLSATEKYDATKRPGAYFAHYEPVNVLTQSIAVTGEKALKVGTSTRLSATASSETRYTITKPGVSWASDHPEIAVVDQNGSVTGVAAGVATITVTSLDGNAKTGYPITVTSGDVAYASSVAVSGGNTVDCGRTLKLSAKALTADGNTPTTPGVIFTSSDTAIASVDENGLVTGKKPGKVTITVASADGRASAAIDIEVKEIHAKKLSLNQKTILVKKGTKYRWLEASFTPEDTTDQKLTWTSSNKKIATVNENGVITARSAGTATITATSVNGLKAKVTVKVTMSDIKIHKIKIDKKLQMAKGESQTLSPDIDPVNATNQKLTYTSSNTKVVTVTGKGKLKAVGKGTAKITIEATDGTGKKAVVKVTVKEKSKKNTGKKKKK